MKHVLLLSALLLPATFAFAQNASNKASPVQQAEVSAVDSIERPVFLKINNAYDRSERPIIYFEVNAVNTVTGEGFIQAGQLGDEDINTPELAALYRDSSAVIFLKPGTYIFTGEDNFCFLTQQIAVITPETRTLDLEVGCE